MTDQPTSRKALYERIRQSSKDEVILEEMIRLGFWPAGDDLPVETEQEIRRKGELERRVRELGGRQRDLQDAAKLKREMRKKRMAEARARRQENRDRRLEVRRERAAAWKVRKTKEILFLGADVSAGLGNRQSDVPRLEGWAAPGPFVCHSAADIADAMKISVGELRFLAFSRRTARVSHYQRFLLPKKSGGTRLISAPMGRLKRAQRWILDHVLDRIPLHDAAHGFRGSRSIVTNAVPHVGADVVVNMDLEDFFPTVSYRRVKGAFRRLGYSEECAIVFALLCTEPTTNAVELDGETYFVASGERHLPQGAPTSPAITNILCFGLDQRLSGLAKKLGFSYTRYADDLSLSAKGRGRDDVGKLLHQARWIIGEEGFRVHPDKTRVFRKGRRQEVTGIVVNDRVAVPRATLRRFRALLHQIDKDGPDGKSWGAGGDVLSSAMGFANFVAMVDLERGVMLREQVQALIDRYGGGPTRGGGGGGGDQPPDDGRGKKPSKKKWWKLF